MTAQTTFKARQRRRIALLALSVALGFATVHMAATPAAACGTECEGPAPSPAPEPKGATPEEIANRGRASAATSADLCDRPTSIKPVDYADDAKTWPCRNFAKRD